MQIFGKSIYIHIPFCIKKCPYCHFYSISSYNLSLLDLYTEALLKEIDLYKDDLKGIISIYFGGGTPLVLGVDNLSKIIDRIFKYCKIDDDIEITIELNPKNVTYERIQFLKDLKINRVSIGVQSFNQNELDCLKRNHSVKNATDTIFIVKDAGINNISIDLLYDIPLQTKKSLKYSLDQIKKLPVDHISIYNLTFEKNTLFYKNKKNILKDIPNDDLSFELLNMIDEDLKNQGFKRYEISAYAKKDLISKHNIGYWTNRFFYGFGASAYSFIENERYQNYCSIEKYINALKNNEKPVYFIDKLSEENRKKELFVINLRMVKGFNIKMFEKRNGKLSEEFFNSIDKLVNEGLLVLENDNIKLSDRGLLFYDFIAVTLI